MNQPKSYVWMDSSGTLRIGESDISLDSVVYAYRRGERPEAIQEQYPNLNLEEVFGAIAYYLANRDTVDAYLKAREQLWERLREETEKNRDPVLERLRALRGAPKVQAP